MFAYILAARAVYALMWFYLAPLLPAMIQDFSVPPSESGLMPAFFIIGAAAAQIPASWIGSKIGDIRTAGLGLFTLGIGSSLVATSPNWWTALAFRAISGVGAGLFFSTAGAALVALRPRSAGSALGWYNASFNIGAFAGYYWGYAAHLLGWRAAALAPALLAVAMSAPLIKEPGLRSSASLSWRAAKLGLASFPIWGAAYAANSLTATWLHFYRGVPASAAGAISSATMASGLLGGMLGSIYDRVRNKRAVPFYSAFLTAVAMAALPLAPAEISPLLVFSYGLGYTVYITSIYAMGAKLGNPSAALAVINVIDMSLGMGFSYVFSYTMELNPAIPWAILSALALISATATLRGAD
ncbi:permease of the major facilitator superfamily [Thermoproteus tenax Kra 1]|uniref:Permease of the major facilitator superfamily n=2 Tax=Thermoproteus tenax TaxID=2271 RepID=G4RQ83_THETK|nr:permease of the major facilitator superfamily [Thermoproteus tenax Kra 1]